MNNPSKENPDDRPQPPQRMNSEERSNEEIRADLARAASPFYCDEQSVADRLAADVETLLARLAAVERDRADLERECYERSLEQQAALARIAAVEAETAERCRLAVAALYTEDSYPPPRGTHRDADPLGAYDSGVADAEIALADIRDAARAVLAASPTPTGPERCPECNHEPGCLCAETPTPHGCRTCLATPTEPTEETL